VERKKNPIIITHLLLHLSTPPPPPHLLSLLTVWVIMKSYLLLLFTICTFLLYSSAELDDNLTYVWPLPAKFSSGNNTLSVDPELSLVLGGKGGDSSIIKDGFGRYKKIIFKHSSKSYSVNKRLVFDIGVLKIVVLSDNEEVSLRLFDVWDCLGNGFWVYERSSDKTEIFSLFYDDDHHHHGDWLIIWVFFFVVLGLLQLQLGVDESYLLLVEKRNGQSIIGEAYIEVKFQFWDFREVVFVSRWRSRWILRLFPEE